MFIQATEVKASNLNTSLQPGIPALIKKQEQEEIKSKPSSFHMVIDDAPRTLFSKISLAVHVHALVVEHCLFRDGRQSIITGVITGKSLGSEVSYSKIF